MVAAGCCDVAGARWIGQGGWKIFGPNPTKSHVSRDEARFRHHPNRNAVTTNDTGAMKSWKQGRDELFEQLENVYNQIGENIALGMESPPSSPGNN